jgi:hypothetical protein
MEDFDPLILLIFQDSIELKAVSVKLCKVKWPEILVISLIY